MVLYSVVIPCYKSSKTIGKVVEMTSVEFRKLGIAALEFVLVNDCSPDEGQTIRELYRLADQYEYVKVVNLGKNGGQHNAIMAGLKYAQGDFIISMDDDMQTDPSQIRFLKGKMDEGYDIVYGYYEEKKESLFRRMGSVLNHWTVRMLIHKPKWLKTSSYWMIRRYVRDYAVEYTHPSVHLQGVFLRITDNIACVPIEHHERAFGQSGYTLKKLVGLYSNIIGFSMTPMHIVTTTGGVLSLVGFLAGLYLLIRKLVHPEILEGWTSTVAALCFFSGVILISLGMVGSYVGRLFIGQTRSPQYVVRDLRNIKEYDHREDLLK